MHAYKFNRIVFGPCWKNDVVEDDAGLFFSQIEFIRIDKKLREIEKLWYKLFLVKKISIN